MEYHLTAYACIRGDPFIHHKMKTIFRLLSFNRYSGFYLPYSDFRLRRDVREQPESDGFPICE